MLSRRFTKQLFQKNRLSMAVENKNKTTEKDVQKVVAEQANVLNKVEQKNEYGEQKQKMQELKQSAFMDYKQYPIHIKHNDPKSKEYIACEQSDIQEKLRHEAYNDMIKNLKLDLQMQELIYESLERLDRPYKRGEGIRGITINAYEDVKDYGKVQDGVIRSRQDRDEQVLEGIKNENRWIDGAVFDLKAKIQFTHHKDYLKELEQRPVNSHFNSHKGYKYDVPVPYESRVPFMADRLGHPELLGTPIERLLRLESDLYHPEYIDQPFVQAPSPNVDPTLNFEEGEVIYENTQLQEWINFWRGSAFMAYMSICYFIPLNYLFFNHTPLEIGTNKSYLMPHDVSFYYFDRFALHVPLMGAFAYYSSYLLLNLSHKFSKDYVVKMQYSKDKELLFVTRVGILGGLEEEVHEMHHVELLPPCTKYSLANHSFQDDDGLIEITNMNGNTNFVVYKGDQYWNPQLKNDFIKSISSLWGKDSVLQTRDQKKAQYNEKVKWAMSFVNQDNLRFKRLSA